MSRALEGGGAVRLPEVEPMRVHTLVIASLLGMAGSSGLAWSLAPTASASAGDEPRAAWGGAKATADEGEARGEDAALAVADPADALPKVRSTFEVDGTIRMEGRLGNATVGSSARETTLFVHLGTAFDVPTDIAAPAEVAIVVDRSGSMKGSRMRNALAAARGLVSRMRDGDTVSVVGYAEESDLLVAPTRLDSRTRPLVAAALSNVSSRGNTCISCGVSTALDLMRGDDRTVQRVMLVSDGFANRGVTTAVGFESIAARARSMQTPIATVGVDVDYDERLLGALSRRTNGLHHFVERIDQLAPIFQREVDAVSTTVATAAAVELELAPGVQLLEVLDRDASRDRGHIVVPFGTFAPGEEKTLLVRVRLPAGARGTTAVGDVTLRYTDAATGRRVEAQGRLEGRVGDRTSEVDPNVEARIAQTETVRSIEEANELLDAGRDAEAAELLARSRRRVQTRRKKMPKGGAMMPVAKRSFDRQLDALGSVSSNVQEVQQARQQNSRDEGRKRKAAKKRNLAEANPFF